MNEMLSNDYIIYRICQTAYLRAQETLDNIASSASVIMGFTGTILAICFGTIDYSALTSRNFWSWCEVAGILLMIISVVLLCRLILRNRRVLHFDLRTLMAFEDQADCTPLLKQMTQTYTELERQCYSLGVVHRTELRTAMVFLAVGLIVLLVSCIVYKGHLF